MNNNERITMLEQFEIFLAARMHEFRPNVCEAFATLFQRGVPDDVQGLHIEVFIDEPGFSFVVFSIRDGIWLTNLSPVQELNCKIDSLWPIVAQDELDRFTIWENDPKGGRVEALEQPIDNLDIPKIVIQWFKEIVSETKGDFHRPITASVHDITDAEEL